MKKNIPFTRSLAIAALLIFILMPGLGWGQTNNYFGTSGVISGAVWSTNPAGPYTDALVLTGGPILNFNNAGSVTSTSIPEAVGFNFGASMIWTPGGTIGAPGINLSINVSTGISQNLPGQIFSTSATAAITKNGAGELAIRGGDFKGGFTLNAGTLIARGMYALGLGELTINGGAISGITSVNFAGKLTGISIVNDFTLGASTGLSLGTADLTFDAVTSLGNNASHTITLGGTGIYTLNGVISGTGSSLTIAATAPGTLSLGGSNTYDGGTTITGGTLLIGAVGVLADAGTVTLNGGTLKSGASTGNSETMGTLALTNNSTISFGTGDHSLIFAASNEISWSGTTLTITGWSGTAGTSGTQGKIFVGTDATGLTLAQLAKISFAGYTTGGKILSTGEIVPASAPPILAADATNNNVDNSINITFAPDATWEAAVTAVKIGGTTLTATTDYVLTAGNLQLKPSGLNALLTTAGSKAVTVEATGYSVASVNQDINAGSATKLGMKTQPTAPAANGAALAVQPEVYIQDQYGNTTTSTATVDAAVGAGTWTLGGTASVAAFAGTTTFSGLTATSAASVTGATISFTSGSLTGVTSSAFNIPAPPTITSSVNTLTGFTYLLGSGPSTSQSFNLSGTNLTGYPGNITVTGSTNYEVSNDNITFGSTTVVAFTSATLTATPVYVRLKAGLSVATYGGELIANTGGGVISAVNVTCNGSVTASAPPIAFNVTGTGSYCTGGLLVRLAGSQLGVNYQLYEGGTNVIGSPVAGTGAAIDFGTHTAGTYTVKGNANGSVPTIAGTTDMNGNAVITVATAPSGNPGPTGIGTSGAPYQFTGASASVGTTVMWTHDGTGSLNNPTLINPVYTSLASPPVVTVNFTLTISHPTCPDAVYYKVLFLTPASLTTSWTGKLDNNWNEIQNWSDGIPGTTSNVTIPAGLTKYPTISAAAVCNNITVQNGGSLIDNGLLTLSSGGKIIVEHAAIATGHWHYISSPVLGVTSYTFLGNFLYDFNTSTDTYTPITATNVSLPAMKGFALYPKTNAFAASYVGGLNPATNNFTISTAGSGWNLIGNPYPSAIDWDATSGWTKAGIVDNAIYIYNGTSWSTYIASVGTGIGTRFIAPTQGFFVKASGGGTMTMTSAVQVQNSVPFYKSSKGAVANMLRMKISGNGYQDDAVVRFLPEATAEFDGNFDAYKRYGDVAEAAQLYTLGSIPLAINSLPEIDNVPVGIKIGADGSYTIAATEMNDIPFATLEDTEKGIFTDLSYSPYTFTSVAGTFDQRFILHFSMLSVAETKSKDAAVYSYQQTVHINLKDQVKGDIFIYSITGQLVASRRSAQGTNEIKLPVTGNYIVKVISKNSTVVRKVFIQ